MSVAMPIYWEDFCEDTAHLTVAQVGALCCLIGLYWCSRRLLPADDEHLARAAKCSPAEWRVEKPIVASFFREEGGGWALLPRPWMRAARGEARRFLGLPTRRAMPADWRRIRAEVFERDDFTCRYCGCRRGQLECDHIIPVSRGGSDDASNLVTACRPCNRLKSARSAAEMGWAV